MLAAASAVPALVPVEAEEVAVAEAEVVVVEEEAVEVAEGAEEEAGQEEVADQEAAAAAGQEEEEEAAAAAATRCCRPPLPGRPPAKRHASTIVSYGIESNLEPKLQFLVEYMGRDLITELTEFMHYFVFILEERTIPRHNASREGRIQPRNELTTRMQHAWGRRQ
ncbi:hypothetical protein ABZP36_006385 [Zizania latifolia]